MDDNDHGNDGTSQTRRKGVAGQDVEQDSPGQQLGHDIGKVIE